VLLQLLYRWQHQYRKLWIPCSWLEGKCPCILNLGHLVVTDKLGIPAVSVSWKKCVYLRTFSEWNITRVIAGNRMGALDILFSELASFTSSWRVRTRLSVLCYKQNQCIRPTLLWRVARLSTTGVGSLTHHQPSLGRCKWVLCIIEVDGQHDMHFAARTPHKPPSPLIGYLKTNVVTHHCKTSGRSEPGIWEVMKLRWGYRGLRTGECQWRIRTLTCSIESLRFPVLRDSKSGTHFPLLFSFATPNLKT
jgi:hypothetical protein